MTPEKPIDVVDVTVNGGEDPNPTATDGGDDGHKTPRLPRWTRHEILVLIEGKRVAETQVRRGRAGAGSGQSEPKWVLISSYCKRHGVNREPVQCRKRWGNLSGDYKKIKEWESQIKDEGESFWIMRNDLRRERKLPGFFDREIYDVIDNGAVTVTGRELVPVAVEEWKDKEGGLGTLGLTPVEDEEEEEEEEAVFDSGRTAAADGIFSDFEQVKHEDEEMEETPPTTKTNPTIPAPLPISERRFEPLYQTIFYQDKANSKQPASNPEKGSPSQEGQKRRRMSSDNGGDTNLQEQLVKVLESNNKMLAAQLEAQNVNCNLDRDQRKDQGDSLIGVLNKIADAIGKIADKI